MSLELGCRRLDVASNLELLGHITTSGCRGLVGTNDLSAGEKPVWEGRIEVAVGMVVARMQLEEGVILVEEEAVMPTLSTSIFSSLE
ncbi:unnamed protein product, partial [Citrullus colocynthis]